MKITYNGKLLDISTPNLEALILQQAGTDQGVAVALDGAVVPRSRWASTANIMALQRGWTHPRGQEGVDRRGRFPEFGRGV